MKPASTSAVAIVFSLLALSAGCTAGSTGPSNELLGVWNYEDPSPGDGVSPIALTCDGSLFPVELAGSLLISAGADDGELLVRAVRDHFGHHPEDEDYHLVGCDLFYRTDDDRSATIEPGQTCVTREPDTAESDIYRIELAATADRIWVDDSGAFQQAEGSAVMTGEMTGATFDCTFSVDVLLAYNEEASNAL
jgi:hypothetical protein